jgi:response regulator RpfG family c-di-GMP phosphodiesterase
MAPAIPGISIMIPASRSRVKPMKMVNPCPKKAKRFPYLGRIVAVADVYDALICKRVYKEAWDEDKVLKLISDERGKQFDPEIVDAFFAGLDEIRAIGKRYPDYES